MYHIKKTIAGIALLLATSLPICADEIVLGADIWPPFNGEPGSDSPGYMVEIAQKVFESKGHTITYKEIPWTRAIISCREGDIQGIIGAAVGDAEDFVFPSEYLGLSANNAFTLKESTFKYDNANSLSGVKVGFIQDYAYGDDLNNFIEANKNSKLIKFMVGNDALKKNIKKLQVHRLDVVIETKSVFEYTANEMGLSDIFKSVGVDGSPDALYIAFSPKNPKSKEYAKILSDGVVELRNNGELEKILKKYGQKDWK